MSHGLANNDKETTRKHVLPSQHSRFTMKSRTLLTAPSHLRKHSCQPASCNSGSPRGCRSFFDTGCLQGQALFKCKSSNHGHCCSGCHARVRSRPQCHGNHCMASAPRDKLAWDCESFDLAKSCALSELEIFSAPRGQRRPRPRPVLCRPQSLHALLRRRHEGPDTREPFL